MTLGVQGCLGTDKMKIQKLTWTTTTTTNDVKKKLSVDYVPV
jgi:hypothetical protein